MQVEDDSQIEPTLLRPDIADVTRPFLVGAIRIEIPVQQVGRDVEAVVAVGRRLDPIQIGAASAKPVRECAAGRRPS